MIPVTTGGCLHRLLSAAPEMMISRNHPCFPENQAVCILLSHLRCPVQPRLGWTESLSPGGCCHLFCP